MSQYLERTDRDHLPVQDDRFPFGGLNPGLNAIRPARALRLIAYWRELVVAIGPYIEGAAFEQCANDLEALLYDEADAYAERQP